MKIEREQLQKYGFEGFKTIRELMSSCREIPKLMGVYVVLREKNNRPTIMDKRPFDCQEDKYASNDDLKAELIKNIKVYCNECKTELNYESAIIHIH